MNTTVSASKLLMTSMAQYALSAGRPHNENNAHTGYVSSRTRA